MKKEKPVRTEPCEWSRKHKMETRVFAREIHEQFCVQPGCRFRGRLAQQGVCHSRDPYVEETGALGWKYIQLVERYAEESLQLLRRARFRSRRDYVKYLESCYACSIMNDAFTLDNLVLLRKENALLKLEVERLGKKVRRLGSR